MPVRLWLPQWLMMEALIRSTRLSEAETLQQHLVEQALATVLIEWGTRWQK